MSEQGGYRYRVRCFGAERSEEAQANLLSSAAHRVWKEWCRKDDETGETVGVQGIDGHLDNAMRFLYQQIQETDVFYSGKHSDEPKRDR
jgi:hypothetical protein